MAKISKLPSHPEKMYKKIEDTIKSRISAYNHGPELAAIIRNIVKEAIKEFPTIGYRTSLTLSGSCNPEDVAAFQRLIKQIDEDGTERMSKMLVAIVRLKIEMCEHMYFCEMEKKKPRLV